MDGWMEWKGKKGKKGKKSPSQDVIRVDEKIEREKEKEKYRETLAAKVHRLVDAPSLPLLPTTAGYKGKNEKEKSRSSDK